MMDRMDFMMEYITPCKGVPLKLVITVCPLILQGIGMFGSKWVTDENCKFDNSTIESAGNYSNGSTQFTNRSVCEAPSGLKELDVTGYGLQAAAFSILLFPSIMLFFEVLFGRDYCENLEVLSYLLYPVAGVLGVVGCTLFTKKFPDSSFGLSFKLCLASCLCVLGVTSISIVFICYRLYKDLKECRREVDVQRVESNSAETPSTTKTPSVKSTGAEAHSVSSATKNVPSVKSIGAGVPYVNDPAENLQSAAKSSGSGETEISLESADNHL